MRTEWVLAFLGVAALALSNNCSAASLPFRNFTSPNTVSNGVGNVLSEAAARDFYLRIMPLGASITRGDPHAPGDPHGNGYRKALRDKLRFDGWKVNMVGNVKYGDMADNVSWERMSRS